MFKRALIAAFGWLALACAAHAQTIINSLPANASPQPSDAFACMAAGATAGQTEKCTASQATAAGMTTATVTPTGANTATTVPNYFSRIRYANDFNASMSGGTVDDCSHDGTAAINAAKTALGGAPGKIMVYIAAGGCVKANVTMGAGWDGITIEAVSPAKVLGSVPSAGVFEPYNTANPVFQLGDTTATVTSIGLRNMKIEGGNSTSSTIGVKIVDGANGVRLDNVSIDDFTTADLQCLSTSSTYAVTRVDVYGGILENYRAGDTFRSEGDNSGYCNGISFHGTYLSSNGVGHVARLIGATQVGMSGGYNQAFYHGGVSIEKGTGNSVVPIFYAPDITFDNGQGSSYVEFENQFGDLQNNSTVQFPTATIGAHIVGQSLFASTVTTGTISAGSNSLALASAPSTVVRGKRILVYAIGAAAPQTSTPGDNGYYAVYAYIGTVSGTTVTLVDSSGAAVNATTAGSSVKVEIGDAIQEGIADAGAAVLNGSGFNFGHGLSLYDFNNKALDGALYLTNGVGPAAPFNGYYEVWQNPTGPYIWANDGDSPTVTAITKSTTVGQITMTGAANTRAADLVCINNEKAAAGINGCWPITAWNSSTGVATFTSSVSGTVSAMTGSPTAAIYKASYFLHGDVQVGNCLRFLDESGNSTCVLSQSNTGSNVTLQAPDRTYGNWIFSGGNTGSTSTFFEFYGNSLVPLSGTLYGCVIFGGSACNATHNGVVVFTNVGADDTASVPSGSIAAWANGNQIHEKDGNGNTGDVFMTQHSATVYTNSPATGATVTIPDTADTGIITPSAGISTLTLNLPTCSSAYNGKHARFTISQTVTTLTVGATAGSVNSKPTAETTANVGHEWVCSGSNTTWYQFY